MVDRSWPRALWPISLATSPALSCASSAWARFFADPAHALVFVRDVRSSVRSLDLELKAVVHLGRVSVFSGIPYGRDIALAGSILRHAAPGKVTLTPTAAAVIEAADDTVLAPAR